ncbi:MAG: TolC family protein [Magnetococcales bacterium]|nr:TolC family protein [Magnetococcales bacterium]
MKVGRSCCVAVLAMAAFLAPDSSVRAETLREAVDGILQRHDRILAAKADVGASDERVSERFKTSFLPTLSLTGHYGHERRMQKSLGTSTDMESRELDVRLTQLLWDFGKANAAVDVARLQKDQTVAALDTAQQNLILDAATAYYQLRRTNNVLRYARQSVENIKRQGEVEDVRVALGRGYSTDVLQVKTQLAGARAREVQATGAVAQSEERVRTVFLRESGEILKLAPPDESFLTNLPKSVDDAVAVGVKKNPQLNQLRLLANMLVSQKRAVERNNFFPTFTGVVERKFKDKVQGVDEFEDETFGKVEMNYPLNLGMASLNSVSAAGQDLEAAQRRYDDTRRLIEEQARVAWHNLNTARANAELLNSQANIAQKFLELAREERKMDKRTLLDILNGETALINARSDAASADTDVIIAAFSLLQAMGSLEPAVLDSGKGAAAKNDANIPVVAPAVGGAVNKPAPAKAQEAPKKTPEAKKAVDKAADKGAEKKPAATPDKKSGAADPKKPAAQKPAP